MYGDDKLKSNAAGIRQEYGGPPDQALTHVSEPLARFGSTKGPVPKGTGPFVYESLHYGALHGN